MESVRFYQSKSISLFKLCISEELKGLFTMMWARFIAGMFISGSHIVIQNFLVTTFKKCKKRKQVKLILIYLV